MAPRHQGEEASAGLHRAPLAMLSIYSIGPGSTFSLHEPNMKGGGGGQQSVRPRPAMYTAQCALSLALRSETLSLCRH
jgi:hypothetical protein